MRHLALFLAFAVSCTASAKDAKRFQERKTFPNSEIELPQFEKAATAEPKFEKPGFQTYRMATPKFSKPTFQSSQFAESKSIAPKTEQSRFDGPVEKWPEKAEPKQKHYWPTTTLDFRISPPKATRVPTYSPPNTVYRIRRSMVQQQF